MNFLTKLYEQHRSFFWFLCAGGLAFWVDFLVLWLLSYCGLNLWLARAISFLAAATFTWIFNSHISFRGRDARFTKLKGWGSYMALAAIGGILNYSASMVVLKLMTPVTPLVMFMAVVAGSFAGLFVNYLTSHYIFFKK